VKYLNKVLIVSYNFPPVGGAGVQRPVKFVKYLRAFGWEPVVLTVANPSVPVYDTALLKDIPKGVKVYGARTLEPSYAQKQGFIVTDNCFKSTIKSLIKKVVAQFMLPDLQILWWPYLTVKLEKIIRAEKPKVLFVSAPPFSSFLPVVFVGRMMKIPVILDYRDEWAFSRDQWENAVKHTIAKRLDLILEGYVVNHCSAFIAANASYVASICSAYPYVTADKGSVVTNGFDEEDFYPEKYGGVVTNDDRLITIVYTGTVWKATSLRNFVTVLKRVLELDSFLRAVLRVKIFGRVVDAEQGYFQDDDLTGILQMFGYIEHDELIRETMAADVLLITLSDLPGADKIITGKVFEYMAAGKQILALVPPGETRDLLTQNYNKLSLAYANDLDGIYAALKDIVTNIKTIRETTGSDVSSFSRKALTSSLAVVFDKIVGIYER